MIIWKIAFKNKSWAQKNISQDSKKLLAMIYTRHDTLFFVNKRLLDFFLSFYFLVFTYQCLVLTWHADTLGFVVSFWSDTKK